MGALVIRIPLISTFFLTQKPHGLPKLYDVFSIAQFELIEPVMPQEAILGLHFEAFASQAHIHFLQNLHRVTPVKNEIRKMKEDLKDLKELNPLTLDHNGCGAPPLSHYLPL